MTVKNCVKAETMISRAASTLLDPLLWYDINPDGLLHPCFLIRLINTSDVDIVINWGGDVAKEVVLAGTSINLPFQENALKSPSGVALMPKGKIFYATADSPGASGRIYLAAYYQD